MPPATRLLLSVLAATVFAGGFLGSLTAATAAKAPPRAVDMRGYPRTYHIWGGEDTSASLARYDMVVGYAYWDIRALRARNPNGIFLLNAGLQPKRPSDYQGLSVTYGALGRWQGGTDRLGGGPKLGVIRAFDPYWDELHNADGSVTEVNDIERHVGWNLAAPPAKRTPDLVARVLAHASKLDGLYTKGWDGIHSDNWIYRIGVDWFYGSNIDSDRDGRVDDYAELRRHWASGLARVGLLLRSFLPGKIVGGNGASSVGPGIGGLDFRPYLSPPDAYLKTANYTLLENLENYTKGSDDVVSGVRTWLGYRDPRGQARYFAIKHKLPGGQGDYRSLRWGFSLATIAGAYYEAFGGSDDNTWWYDEYDGGEGIRHRNWLGQALSSPERLPDGVWRRDFQNGVVLNNSTSLAQTFPLGGTYRRLAGTQDPAVNDGATVSTVTIPSGDGLFLVRQ